MRAPQPSRWFPGILCVLLLVLCGCQGNRGYPDVPCTDPRDFSNESIQRDLFIDADGSGGSAYMVGPGEYVISRVGQNLYEFSRAMFSAIAAPDGELAGIVSKLILLYMTLYGLMVALGLTQIQLGDALMRGFKLSILAMLFSPAGVDIFYGLAGKFFLEGVDQVIGLITEQVGRAGDMLQKQSTSALLCSSIDTSVARGEAGTAAMFGSVFRPIDMVLGKLLSFPAIRFYQACTTAFPNGLFFLLVLMIGLMTLILAICTAMWIYLLSLVARSLLLALGPVFISLMLFKQTWMYFDAWLKQLINFSLKPILNFAFLGLFVVLVNTSLNQMFFGDNSEMRISVCYTPFTLLGSGSAPDTSGGIRQEVINTLNNLFWGWQFACPDQCTCENNTAACRPKPLLNFFGITGYNADCASVQGQMFPIDFADALVFMALCWLACRFQPEINKMANEMSMVFMWLEGPPKAAGTMFNIQGLITGSTREKEGLNSANLAKFGQSIQNAAGGAQAGKTVQRVPIIGGLLSRGVQGVNAAGRALGSVNQEGKISGGLAKRIKDGDEKLSKAGWGVGMLYDKAKEIPQMGIGNIPGMGFFNIKGNQDLVKKHDKQKQDARDAFDEKRRERGLDGDPINQEKINEAKKAARDAKNAQRRASGLPELDDDD